MRRGWDRPGFSARALEYFTVCEFVNTFSEVFLRFCKLLIIKHLDTSSFTNRDILCPVLIEQDGVEARLRRNISRLIDDRGIKFYRFAAVAGRKASWASMYLQGKRRFPLDHLDAVADFLGVSSAELIGSEEVPRQRSRPG